jgi:hypothetical protein
LSELRVLFKYLLKKICAALVVEVIIIRVQQDAISGHVALTFITKIFGGFE